MAIPYARLKLEMESKVSALYTYLQQHGPTDISKCAEVCHAGVSTIDRWGTRYPDVFDIRKRVVRVLDGAPNPHPQSAPLGEITITPPPRKAKIKKADEDKLDRILSILESGSTKSNALPPKVIELWDKYKDVPLDEEQNAMGKALQPLGKERAIHVAVRLLVLVAKDNG